MQTETPVETHHEIAKVITQTDARSECHLTHYVLYFEVTAWAIGVMVHRPHITCVKEKSTIERAHEVGSILKIDLKLDVTRLFYIRTAAH